LSSKVKTPSPGEKKGNLSLNVREEAVLSVLGKKKEKELKMEREGKTFGRP